MLNYKQTDRPAITESKNMELYKAVHSAQHCQRNFDLSKKMPTEDIKTLVTLTPVKAGSLIHVVCQCQTWNAAQADGTADAYARLTHNNGGTTTVFAEIDRAQGNFAMDERYRHSPITVEGWFTTSTTNATQIKFQGNQAASMPVAFNWFHSYGGFVTVMEYDIT